MEIRDARPDDADAIRSIARESMVASYTPGVEEGVIEATVDRWYSADSIRDALEDPDTVFLVAEDGSPVAFSKGTVIDRRERTGEIHWLHVHPDSRTEGLGSRLLAATEREFESRDTKRLAGYVLTVNDLGTEFYESNGYDPVGERRINVGDRSFEEREYEKFLAETADATTPLEPVDGPEDDTLYVDFEDARRGGSAAFYPVYRGPDRDRRYGWYCGECDSMDIVMDTMDRVECNGCGNRGEPTRWDAAYL